MQTVALSDQGKGTLGAAPPPPCSVWTADGMHAPPLLSVVIPQQSGLGLRSHLHCLESLPHKQVCRFAPFLGAPPRAFCSPFIYSAFFFPLRKP